MHRLNAFLAQETLITYDFIGSCIDYWSSLLYDICHYNINHVQPIQDSAGRIVTNIRK